MKVYLIDTCTYYAYINNTPYVKDAYLSVHVDKIKTCDTVISEIVRRRLNTIENVKKKNATEASISQAYYWLRRTILDISEMNCVDYNAECESNFQRIYSIAGRPQHKDCRIAATAMAHNLIVVTANVKDFLPIMPRERIQDWTRPDRGIEG